MLLVSGHDEGRKVVDDMSGPLLVAVGSPSPLPQHFGHIHDRRTCFSAAPCLLLQGRRILGLKTVQPNRTMRTSPVCSSQSDGELDAHAAGNDKRLSWHDDRSSLRQAVAADSDCWSGQAASCRRAPS